MKKLITTILATSMLFGIASCSKKEPEETKVTTEANSSQEEVDSTSENQSNQEVPKGDTVGTKLFSAFAQSISTTKDLKATAEEISDSKISGYECAVNEMSEGFLNGFDADITGFNKCYGFGPMIGSIPYVCYLFETDDANALKENLLKHADPRWNICTEADETVCEIYGDYVFFVMCIQD